MSYQQGHAQKRRTRLEIEHTPPDTLPGLYTDTGHNDESTQHPQNGETR